jgi:hypothetical protein
MIGAALAAVTIGAPAMAQSWDPNVGSGNIVGSYSHPYSGPTIPQSHYGYSTYGASGAYAFAPSRDEGYYGYRRMHDRYRD